MVPTGLACWSGSFTDGIKNSENVIIRSDSILRHETPSAMLLPRESSQNRSQTVFMCARTIN